MLPESLGFAGIFRLIRVQRAGRREARRFLITMENVMSHLAKRFARVLLTAIVASAALGSQFAAALEVGDKAPDFSLAASDGSTYSLSQFLGEKPVVIAFFPKAFTGG
jgi:hypothetical protein